MNSKQKEKFRRIEESLDDIKNPYENLDYHLFREFKSYEFSVAVPRNADEELKRKVHAALKSHVAGIKSVDYVLKKYGNDWRFPDKPKSHEDIIENILNKVLNELLTILYNFSEDIKEAHSKAPNIMGIVAADLALQRCLSNFEAIAVLMRRGYFIEPRALLRNILEQTAWAYAVINFDHIDEIEKTSSSNSISQLKTIFSQCRKDIRRII